MLRKLYVALRDFMRQLSRDHISAFAASTAFFLFLSLIPMLILLCSLLPYTPLTKADLLEVAAEVTPGYVDSLLTSMISEVYGHSAGLVSLALLATIWASGKGVLALMRGLNAVNGVKEDRNYVLLRLLACFYTILIVMAIVLSLLAMVFGNVLLDALHEYVPGSREVTPYLLHFRFLWVWLILAVFFVLLYTFIPNRKMRLREQIPGAIFTAIAWSVFSWVFSIVVERFHGFSMYGSLTTIVVFMIWLYFCMYLVLIGACLNRDWEPLLSYLGFRHDRELGLGEKTM